MMQLGQLSPINNLLYVDDDSDSVRYLDIVLPSNCVMTVVSDLSAFERINPDATDIVLIDPDFCGGKGLSLIGHIHSRWPDTIVIALSHSADPDSIVSAIKGGADYFFAKPIRRSQIDKILRSRWTRNRDITQRDDLIKWQLVTFGFDFLPNSVRFRKQIAAVLNNELNHRAPILTVGEQGTGRRRLARKIHEIDHRKARLAKTFLDMDARDYTACPHLVCDAIDREFPSEKLGTAHKSADVKAPNGGTIYISDIEELPPRVLTDISKRIVALSGNNYPYSVRFIVSITSLKGIKKSSSLARFIQDHFVLNRIDHPPLRHHPEDIPRLAEYYLNETLATGRTQMKLEHCAVRKLRAHAWPGNITELQQTMYKVASEVGSERITAADIYIDGINAEPGLT